MIRSDRGAEFGTGANGSLEAKAFWHEKGIIHTVVPPGNHAQNGKVERPHLTILQTTRTLLIDSGMPGIFWPEAALYSVHVYKRLPNTSNVIPWSKFTNDTSKVKLCHTFGGKCWFRDNNNQSKLAPRYEDAKFINYIDGSDTTLKIWDIDSGRCRLVRDVVLGTGSDPGSTARVISPLDDSINTTTLIEADENSKADDDSKASSDSRLLPSLQSSDSRASILNKSPDMSPDGSCTASTLDAPSSIFLPSGSARSEQIL